MNPSMKDFFDDEKKQVFSPDPYFATRVMARLREAQVQSREYGIWDVIPTSARPVFGLALVLMMAFIGVQLFVPQMPEQGFVTSVLEAEQSQSEAPYLYSGAEMPADHELLNQLMGFEER